jgi:hypothetical protein
MRRDPRHSPNTHTRRLRPRTRPHCRSGDNVIRHTRRGACFRLARLGAAVHVVHDARVVVAVSAGKRHASGELYGAIAHDFDLHAVGVELGAAGGVDEEGDVAFVQGDEFGADEVS